MKTSSYTSMTQPTVLIIGAGICGLSIGWQVIQAGARVKIYEAHSVGSGATNCSGGMLAAGIENEPSEDALWSLTKYSQSLWHNFRKEIEYISRMSIDYRTEGTIMIATNQDDKKHMDFLYAYQKTIGVEMEKLSAYDVQKREPHLKTVGGIYYPKDHQVNSMLLSQALSIAIKNTGGEIYTKTPVHSIRQKGAKATGITLRDGTQVAGDKVVVCAGVNCSTLKGIDDPLPLRPLKGQMLSLHMSPALIEHVVWTPRTYLIPKTDGTLIIGATVEEKGFDANNTAGGMLSLLDTAWRALPAIEDLPIKDMWVGHRPTARDDAPILGELAIKNTYIATGHHRNGILLAPATGKIMADLIVGKKCSKFLPMFTIERFKTCI